MGNVLQSAKKLIKRREFYIVYLTLVLWILIGLMNENFFSLRYLAELIGVSGIYFICSFGVLPLMIKGDFNLSIGGLMAMVGLVTMAMLGSLHLPLWLAILVGIGTGGILGGLNGWIIAKLKVSSVVVTLAMMNIYYGLARFIGRRAGIGNALVDRGLFENLPSGILLMNVTILVVLGITFYFLKFSQLGRCVFAFGGNRKLALLKGFNEERVTIGTHMFSGLAGGLAAVLHMITFQQMSIEVYNGIEFELIIIVIIGGLNILGGYGSVLGTFFASLFIVILKSGLVFAKISVFWHDMLVGFIIILLVSFEMYRHKKQQQMLLEQG